MRISREGGMRERERDRVFTIAAPPVTSHNTTRKTSRNRIPTLRLLVIIKGIHYDISNIEVTLIESKKIYALCWLRNKRYMTDIQN